MRTLRQQVEAEEQWRKYEHAAKPFHLPEGWTIRLCPPFGGVMIRAAIASDVGNKFSIFLDCTGAASINPNPYWEVYDFATEEVWRFDLEQQDEMIEWMKEEARKLSSKEKL